MLSDDQLSDCINALNKGDDAAQRQAVHALKDYAPDEWAHVSAKAIKLLVAALQHENIGGVKQTFIRQEIFTVLGNIGVRAAPAVPYIVESLSPDIPDGIR